MKKISVLSGDIGTKTRLAIVTVSGNQVAIEHEVSYPSQKCFV